MTAHGRRPLVAGNWKMHTTVTEGVALARAIVAATRPDGVDLALLPPFPHLVPVGEALAGSGVLLGAQDCFWEATGPYTGEVSPTMLAPICDLVLVGHSERRALGETDEQVGAKARAALDAGLAVIVACGEVLAERQAGCAEDVVVRQLSAVTAAIGPLDPSRVVFAYEPVWAIGSGMAATPEDAQSMCATIRAHGGDPALRVLYGGSVTPATAAGLLAGDDVDGALVGGASLRVADLLGIAAAAGGQR